ncbi:MAG: DUF3750 domain-containing protein [Akkermansiaceae bacterium]|jgi:hypothetical protein
MIFKALVTAIILSFASCQQTTIHREATVVIKDVRIPKGMPWYSRFASHSFSDYRSGDSSTWRRVEIVNKDSGITITKLTEEDVHKATRWDNPVHIVSQGNPPAPATAAAIELVTRSYDASIYRPYPGPNSNTFTREIIMKVDGQSSSTMPSARNSPGTLDAHPAEPGSNSKRPSLAQPLACAKESRSTFSASPSESESGHLPSKFLFSRRCPYVR